jgi:hypothetical protein
MNAMLGLPGTDKYAHCVKASKALHWEIEKDVVQGSRLETSRKFMPDRLTLVHEATLAPSIRRSKVRALIMPWRGIT